MYLNIMINICNACQKSLHRAEKKKHKETKENHERKQQCAEPTVGTTSLGSSETLGTSVDWVPKAFWNSQHAPQPRCRLALANYKKTATIHHKFIKFPSRVQCERENSPKCCTVLATWDNWSVKSATTLGWSLGNLHIQDQHGGDMATIALCRESEPLEPPFALKGGEIKRTRFYPSA